MANGIIEGIGPRYCPSIESKILRFPDKDRHQLFLEPEGWHTEEVYVQGMSTSLPVDVQEAFLHTIPGLEKARIMRPGTTTTITTIMDTSRAMCTSTAWAHWTSASRARR